MMRPWVTTSYRQARMRVRRSLRRRDRGFTSTNRPRLAISVPPKHDNTRGKPTVLQQRPRIDAMSDCVAGQAAAGLLSVIPRVPDHATHMFPRVTVATIDPGTN